MLLDFNDIVKFSKTYGTPPYKDLFFLSMTLKKSIFDKIDYVKLLTHTKAILVSYNNYYITYSDIIFDKYNRPDNIIGFRCLLNRQETHDWNNNEFKKEHLKLLLENNVIK